MNLKFLITSLIFLFNFIFAQENEFDKFVKQNEAKFDEFVKQSETRWQDFVDLSSKEWEEFVQKIQNKWGDDSKFSDNKTWIRYSEDLETRTVSDFENGNIEIETLGTEDETKEELITKSKELLSEILSEKAEKSDTQPILDNDIIEEVETEEIPEDYIEVVPAVTPTAEKVKKLVITIPFKEGYLKKLAERVIPHVEKYSSYYQIDPKLIMAIIHTESSFNPKARSTFTMSNGKKGHAYGLMQLVPFSGGREAYRFLGNYGDPTPEYLYDISNNIQLGTTYLHLLSTNYFSDVYDSQKNTYLIIAAYNTGPGNVARACVGNRSVQKAVEKVNSMGSSATLYDHLVDNLPYQETKKYLERVLNRITLY